MGRTELTTMCVIKSGTKVLMINRRRQWTGWAFPGGHLENRESLSECVKREIFEETGLCVESLHYKGIANIYNTNTNDRLLVFNYYSDKFSGKLKKNCEEGDLKWVELEEINNLCFAEGLEYRLPLFLDDGIQDLYIEWNQNTHYTKVQYESL